MTPGRFRSCNYRIRTAVTAAHPLLDSPRLFALVPCAGVGERAAAAGPKQYAVLAGKSMVAHTLGSLSQVKRLSATLVVLSPGDAEFERHAPEFKGLVARCGGEFHEHTSSCWP